MMDYRIALGLCCCLFFFACQDDEGSLTDIPDTPDNPQNPIDPDDNTGNNSSSIQSTFLGRIDPNNLLNYANQAIPNYINKDNTQGNPITDAGATLGRVLFYDPILSIDNSIACASCHVQINGFSDLDQVSTGVNGITSRHSMRLINSRFADEENFFWDERANTLEDQTTRPIQDHIEMGFSGQNGAPDLSDLIDKLSTEGYYQELFSMVYGNETITEGRIQEAIAQFVRSIQSFDSKYDQGRALVNNNNNPFPNFTDSENRGKMLFMQNAQFGPGGRTGGGLGCNACHRAPEFDITPGSDNNGVIASALDPNEVELNITRSPTLRDLFDPEGNLNGPMMHNGAFGTIDQVIDHYNNIPTQGNNNLDNRLRRGGMGQRLNITAQERTDLIAFLHTLTGRDVYQNEKWSNPFEN